MSKNQKPDEPGASQPTQIVKRPRPELEPAEVPDPTATLIHRVEDLERTRQATQAMPLVAAEAAEAEEGTVAIPVMALNPEAALGTVRLDRSEIAAAAPAPVSDAAPDRTGYSEVDPTSRVMVSLADLARMVEPRPAAAVQPDQTARLSVQEPDLKLRAPLEDDFEPTTSLMPVELQAPKDSTQIVRPTPEIPAPEPAAAPGPEAGDTESRTAPIERPPAPVPPPAPATLLLPPGEAARMAAPPEAPAAAEESTAPIQRPMPQAIAAAQSTLVLPPGEAARMQRAALAAAEPAPAPVPEPAAAVPAPPAPDATRLVPVAEMLALVEAAESAKLAAEPQTAPIERLAEALPASLVPEPAEVPSDATLLVPLSELLALPAVPAPAKNEVATEAPPPQATLIVSRAELQSISEPSLEATAVHRADAVEASRTGPQRLVEAPPTAPASGTVLVPLEELSLLAEIPPPSPARDPEVAPIAPAQASSTMKVAPSRPATASVYALPAPIPQPTAPPVAKAVSGQGKLWIGVFLLVGLIVAVGLFLWKPWAATGPKAAEGPSFLPRLESHKGVPPNLEPYLEKAKAGDASAMRYLGVCYYNGLGVAADREEGLRWYRKAAEAGSQAARRELPELEAAKK